MLETQVHNKVAIFRSAAVLDGALQLYIPTLQMRPYGCITYSFAMIAHLRTHQTICPLHVALLLFSHDMSVATSAS